MSAGGPQVPDPNLPSNEVQLLRYIASYLAQIQTNTGSGGGGTTPVGKQRTLTSSNVTGNGSVAAGAVGVQFTLSTDFAGTINGDTYSGATTFSWSPPPLSVPGDTYPAIPYTISAGNANLDVLT